MSLSLNSLSFKKFLSDFFNSKELSFLLPIVIIFSSLKIYGYIFFFVFYLPYIIIKREKIYLSIKNSNLVEKTVLVYFLFLLLETLYGSYFISDIRIIIYWIPLIITVISAYFINILDIKESKFYKNNYLKILFKSSLIYFIFYFVLSIVSYIFGKGFYSVQDNFWGGSSSAFATSSILFYSVYQLWEKENFRFFSIYSLVVVFYNLMCNIHYSRLSLLYVIFFTTFLVIRNIQLKKFLNSFFLLLLVISSFSLTFNGTQILHNKLASIKPGSSGPLKVLPSTKGIIQNDGRLNQLYKGFKVFDRYPILNKFIGTGWYSSRITVKYDEQNIKTRKFYSYNKSCDVNLKSCTENRGYSLQAIVALLLDTGILGLMFIGYLYALNLYLIIKNKYHFTGNLFLCSMLSLNFIALFIGYPLANISYILFLVPNGIINSNIKE